VVDLAAGRPDWHRIAAYERLEEQFVDAICMATVSVAGHREPRHLSLAGAVWRVSSVASLGLPLCGRAPGCCGPTTRSVRRSSRALAVGSLPSPPGLLAMHNAFDECVCNRGQSSSSGRLVDVMQSWMGAFELRLAHTFGPLALGGPMMMVIGGDKWRSSSQQGDALVSTAPSGEKGLGPVGDSAVSATFYLIYSARLQRCGEAAAAVVPAVIRLVQNQQDTRFRVAMDRWCSKASVLTWLRLNDHDFIGTCQVWNTTSLRPSPFELDDTKVSSRKTLQRPKKEEQLEMDSWWERHTQAEREARPRPRSNLPDGCTFSSGARTCYYRYLDTVGPVLCSHGRQLKPYEVAWGIASD